LAPNWSRNAIANHSSLPGPCTGSGSNSIPTRCRSRRIGQDLQEKSLATTALHPPPTAARLTRGLRRRDSVERYIRSDAPDFEAKAAAVTGFCLNPSQHAAVSPMRGRRFRPLIEHLGPCCRPRPAASATGSRVTARARCRCLPPWTQRPVKCSGRPCPAKPVRHSSASWATRRSRAGMSST
jgi:hypothetical protein